MNPADDEIDNLLRNHFAGELDPMRGQAARAFDREVTGPMRRRLRVLTPAALRDRLRQALPLAMTMAACCALGFFVPSWLSEDAPAVRPTVALVPAANPVVPTRQGPVESVGYAKPGRGGLFDVRDLPLHLGTRPQTLVDASVSQPLVWRDDLAATIWRYTDSWHSIVMVAHGNDRWAWVADAAGDRVFDGPVDTAEAMADVPDECRQKVEVGRRSLEQVLALRAMGASGR